MKKIFIATTSFSTQSKKPFALLKSNNLKIVSNNKGRKLKSGELIRENSDFDAQELLIQMEIEATENLIKGLNEK